MGAKFDPDYGYEEFRRADSFLLLTISTPYSVEFKNRLSPAEVFQELQEDEEPCYGKKCTANEHCCPGSVCVDVDGIVGSCLFAYGLKQGELCRRDNDCETGLLCTETGGEGRTCQPPSSNKKQYSEDCTMSSECDIGKGLCCQLQRRHRQAARKYRVYTTKVWDLRDLRARILEVIDIISPSMLKRTWTEIEYRLDTHRATKEAHMEVCSYFKDPLICIGPVATDQVKDDNIEHTAGEKRLTGKAASVNAFTHLRRRK
ncbi:hypothetical protein ANN_07989 [Periplaneta americana]|uniref:Uncharacterized protein n=1 Tax=Periplaneta americana TaxID=6978 RepID=A0ABQ8T1J9_PERAM|nr:hypothetical protein ANN_07989 [Periplaneta americana]